MTAPAKVGDKLANGDTIARLYWLDAVGGDGWYAVLTRNGHTFTPTFLGWKLPTITDGQLDRVSA